MSKSRGSEAVEKITNKYGADLLRLWTASIDFTEDVRLSDTILERLIEAYRKLRNTLRYALGNLYDFDPARDAVPVEEMLDIDRWILARTETLIRRCRASYDDLEFHKVYRAIYDFATTDLSSLYFDVLKDRLYTAAYGECRAAQRADGAVPDSLCAGAADGAAAGPSPRKKPGASRPSLRALRTAYIWRCCRSRRKRRPGSMRRSSRIGTRWSRLVSRC